MPLDIEFMDVTELLEQAETLARKQLHQVAEVRRDARRNLDELNREFKARGLDMIQF